MSHDDLHVLMYKVLAYLYDCMKHGTRPDATRVSHEHLGIGYCYWCSVWKELVSRGLVDGVSLIATDQSDVVYPVFDAPTITLEGIEFMQENASMKRALRFLQDIKAIAPFV